jgi:hypothetical protein
MELLMDVAKRHSPSAASWFESLKSQPQFSNEDSLLNEVRSFMNASKAK